MRKIILLGLFAGILGLFGCSSNKDFFGFTGDNNGTGDFFNQNVLTQSQENIKSKGFLNARTSVNPSVPSSVGGNAMKMQDMSAEANIGFKVGNEQDLMLFRDNILAGHIPNPDVLTYNGIFGDYHFPLPEGNCDDMFCPLVAADQVDDEYWMQIGLGSNIQQKDFQRPPTNFVFVIDRSGSMDGGLNSYYYDEIFQPKPFCDIDEVYFRPGAKCINKNQKVEYENEYKELAQKNKMELAMQALSEMIYKLQPQDRIGIVLFDTNAEVAHPLVQVDKIDLDMLKSHLVQITPRGSTNMENGLTKGLELLEDVDDEYQNRIVFITDAMPNTGVSSPGGLGYMVNNAIQQGNQFTFMGVGVDFQQAFVQKLTRQRGTNYFFVSDAWDFQRRLVEEFDYNFFPMIYDLSLSTDKPDMIDTVYGTDMNNPEAGEVVHINTLFPTPPTDVGHRGSIILLKLKQRPNENIKFNVKYETYDGQKKDVEVSFDQDDIKSNQTIQKALILVKYVDTLKQAIQNQEVDNLGNIKNYLKQNQEIFQGDDAKMYNQELEVIAKLQELLENNQRPHDDYWQE